MKDTTYKASKNKQLEWTQTITKGDITETIRVEKLDNEGYLVCLNRYGYSPKDIKKEKYISETKKFFSETNPLDKDESNDPFNELVSMLTFNK